MNSSWTMCSKTSVRISSSCLEQCNALATFVSPSSSFVCPVISFGFAFDEHWWTLMNTVRLWVPEIDRWKWREREVGSASTTRGVKCVNRKMLKNCTIVTSLRQWYCQEVCLKSLEDNLIDRGLQTSERDLQYLYNIFSCFWTKYCVKCKQDRCHRDVTCVSTFLALCFCLRKSGPVAL